MNDRKESLIRDQLAQNLSLIEPGLSLVGVEFHLKNPHGARGFIDILARDSLGNLVIIELKRSEASAGRAIHELFKYATLIRSEHGVGVEKIRCLLLSTVWSELLVPFSEFVRNIEFAAEGKRLVLDACGAVIGIVPVSLVIDPTPVRLLPWHGIHLYDDPASRNSDALKLAEGFQSVGLADYVLVLLDHVKGHRDVIYRSAIYSAMSTSFADGRHLVAYDSPEYEQYDSLSFRATRGLRPSDIEIGYPDKLRLILDSWDIREIVRGGCFSSDLLWPEDGLLGLILSEDGRHSAWFDATASPRHAPSWRTLRANVIDFLGGNSRWSQGVSRVLDDLSADGAATVSLEIFDPRDIVSAIGHAVRNGNTFAFPVLELIVDDGGEGRLIEGFSCWDGVTRPVGPEGVVGGVLSGGIGEYLDLLHFDGVGLYDEEMMACHGFSYEMFEVQEGAFVKRFASDFMAWVEFDESQRRIFKPVVEFMESNREYCRDVESLTRPAFVTEG